MPRKDNPPELVVAIPHDDTWFSQTIDRILPFGRLSHALMRK